MPNHIESDEEVEAALDRAAKRRGQQCERCGVMYGPASPGHGLWCDKCRADRQRTAEAYAVPPTPVDRSIRYVAGESEAGKSSGKERKSMCYGDAENSNGLWDNLVRSMEE